MKVPFLLLALLTGCASWGFRDVALEAVAVGALGVDAALTVRGQDLGMKEGNPLLGAHPSTAGIITYTASAAVIHIAVAALIDDRHWRLFWQGSWIGIESWCIFSNAYMLGSR